MGKASTARQREAYRKAKALSYYQNRQDPVRPLAPEWDPVRIGSMGARVHLGDVVANRVMCWTEAVGAGLLYVTLGVGGAVTCNACQNIVIHGLAPSSLLLPPAWLQQDLADAIRLNQMVPIAERLAQALRDDRLDFAAELLRTLNADQDRIRKLGDRRG